MLLSTRLCYSTKLPMRKSFLKKTMYPSVTTETERNENGHFSKMNK